jgi:type III secretion system (T3SS) SseB-like protein
MDWQKLAKHVVLRRSELGFNTREKFAQHASMSARLLGDIENARRNSYDRTSLVKLEHALSWADGSIDRVLAGAEPIAIAPTPGTDTGKRTASGPAIWLAELTEPGLADLSPYVRAALDLHVQTLRARLEHDLGRITLNLRTYASEGFQPANVAEARMLVYQASPERAREKPWRLVVAMAELDRLFLGVPPGASTRLSDLPWSEMSDPVGRPLRVIPLFTSRERLADYREGLQPVAASAREIVEALPREESDARVIAFSVNPGGPLSFTITDTSLRDAAALVDGEVELYLDALD